MTLPRRKVMLALAIFLATHSMASVFACECDKIDKGQKSQTQVLKTESAPEMGSSLAATTFGEMDQMAAESRALDKAAGLDSGQ